MADGGDLCCCAQGEDQKKLDVISNEVFCNALRASGRTGVIASEEEDLPVSVEETYSGRRPCCCFTLAAKAYISGNPFHAMNLILLPLKPSRDCKPSMILVQREKPLDPGDEVVCQETGGAVDGTQKFCAAQNFPYVPGADQVQIAEQIVVRI